MSTIHTKGRITVRENGEANSYTILDDRGYWLLSLLHNGQQVTSTQRENLRRLVACWNACEDEDTSMLEAIVNDGTTVRARHDDALRLKETYQRELCAMEHQRDELLALVKRNLQRGRHFVKDDELAETRAVVAKVEGRTA